MPFIVRTVPPPVPPLIGLNEVMIGVNDVKYENVKDVALVTIEFVCTTTLHVVLIDAVLFDAGGV